MSFLSVSSQKSLNQENALYSLLQPQKQTKKKIIFELISNPSKDRCWPSLVFLPVPGSRTKKPFHSLCTQECLRVPTLWSLTKFQNVSKINLKILGFADVWEPWCFVFCRIDVNGKVDRNSATDSIQFVLIRSDLSCTARIRCQNPLSLSVSEVHIQFQASTSPFPVAPEHQFIFHFFFSRAVQPAKFHCSNHSVCSSACSSVNFTPTHPPTSTRKKLKLHHKSAFCRNQPQSELNPSSSNKQTWNPWLSGFRPTEPEDSVQTRCFFFTWHPVQWHPMFSFFLQNITTLTPQVLRSVLHDVPFEYQVAPRRFLNFHPFVGSLSWALWKQCHLTTLKRNDLGLVHTFCDAALEIGDNRHKTGPPGVIHKQGNWWVLLCLCPSPFVTSRKRWDSQYFFLSLSSPYPATFQTPETGFRATCGWKTGPRTSYVKRSRAFSVGLMKAQDTLLITFWVLKPKTWRECFCNSLLSNKPFFLKKKKQLCLLPGIQMSLLHVLKKSFAHNDAFSPLGFCTAC